jgi:ferredoxin
VSWKEELRPQLEDIFDGVVFGRSSSASPPSTSEVLRGRVFVALHMHAGDGNVHTNIPVNSDHYEMLQTANRAVDRIMALARSARRRDLRRARHRHHQARIPHRRRNPAVPRLQGAVDPKAASTRASCCPAPTWQRLHAQRSRLLGTESLIMEQSEIGNIATMVKDCLRCGKCKPVCSTHVPRANLLYSPRNKILATSLLIEAFLYEEQTRRGVSLRTSTSSTTSPTTARSATSASSPARWTSTSATSRSRCATCCASRARRSSCRPRPRRWPS